jgi:uncharacterized metal-binding protein
MASGKTHDWTTIALSIGLSIWQPAIGIGCLLGGLLLSPDLDMPGSKPSQRMFGIYRPYAMLCGRHRSPLSHLPIVGTVGRVAYLAAIVWLLDQLFHWEIVPEPWMLEGIIGIEASALLHYALDLGKSGWLIRWRSRR